MNRCICTDSDAYTWLYNQYQSEFPDHEIDVDVVLFCDDEYCACKCHAKTKEDEENFTSGEYLKKPDLNKSVIKFLKEKWKDESVG